MRKPRLEHHVRAGPTAPLTALGPDGAGCPAGPGRYYHVACREANVSWLPSEDTIPGTAISTAAVVCTHDGSGPVYQHEPEWLVRPARKGAVKVTPQAVANRVAETMQNATGLIAVTLWEDGTPTFACVFAATGRQVLCVRTTDQGRQKVEHPAVLDPAGWRQRAADAIARARAERQTRTEAKGVA